MSRRKATPRRGLIKVKLLHRLGATVLQPELLILGCDRAQWAQPQRFLAPLLNLTPGSESVPLHFTVVDRTLAQASGLECTALFRPDDLQATLRDGFQLYSCEIFSDHGDGDLAVGRCRERPDGGIDLRLFHHTTPAGAAGIRSSNVLWGSEWNFQGVRRLENVRYAYFTSLERLCDDADFHRVAMASDEKLPLFLDQNDTDIPDLVLPVYRGSTTDRSATLPLWVPFEALATPHVLKHTGFGVFYEIAHPWIHRLGLEPGHDLPIRGRTAIPSATSVKSFDYAVIGDCTTEAGLRAVYDEENTSETFQVAEQNGRDVFAYWRAHANQQLHSNPTDVQALRAPGA